MDSGSALANSLHEIKIGPGSLWCVSPIKNRLLNWSSILRVDKLKLPEKRSLLFGKGNYSKSSIRFPTGSFFLSSLILIFWLIFLFQVYRVFLIVRASRVFESMKCSGLSNLLLSWVFLVFWVFIRLESFRSFAFVEFLELLALFSLLSLSRLLSLSSFLSYDFLASFCFLNCVFKVFRFSVIWVWTSRPSQVFLVRLAWVFWVFGACVFPCFGSFMSFASAKSFDQWIFKSLDWIPYFYLFKSCAAFGSFTSIGPFYVISLSSLHQVFWMLRVFWVS